MPSSVSVSVLCKKVPRMIARIVSSLFEPPLRTAGLVALFASLPFSPLPAAGVRAPLLRCTNESERLRARRGNRIRRNTPVQCQ